MPAINKLIQYFEEIKSDSLPQRNIDDFVDQDPVFRNTIIYVHDFLQKKMMHVKGFETVLGYKNDSLTVQELHDLIHPDDRYSVFNMSKFVIEQIIKHKLKPDVNKDIFALTYRMKHKSEGYIRIIRESAILDIDSNNMPIRSLSICKKFNANLGSNKVIMETEGDFAHIVNYESYIKEYGDSYQDTFSSREMDILRLMEKGNQINEIATVLHIAFPTVRNHRTKMFKKASVQNVTELLNFAREKGII